MRFHATENGNIQFTPEEEAEADIREAAALEAANRAAIPASVSPRQIRQALTRAGLRAAIEAAIAAGDQDTKDWWEFATAFERSHLMVVAMGAALGKTPRELDDLFTLAGTL